MTMTDFKQMFVNYDKYRLYEINHLGQDIFGGFGPFKVKAEKCVEYAIKTLFKSINEEEFWNKYNKTYYIGYKNFTIYVNSKKEEEIKKKIREKYNENEIVFNDVYIEESLASSGPDVFDIDDWNMNYHNGIRIRFIA